MQLQSGVWYEFHRSRVTSRAGQPISVVPGAEIGPQLADAAARRQVQNGKDVYTVLRRDAERLAASIYVGRPVYDPPHQPMHFQHFHPGGIHPQFPQGQQGRPRAEMGVGHVFFGSRGERYLPGG